MLTPKNKKCSIDAIQAQLGVSRAVAKSEYASVINKVSGEISDGDFTVNQKGIKNDVTVRKQFGGFSGVQADFDFNAALKPGQGKLIDYSVRDASVKRFKNHPLKGNCSEACA